MKKLKLGLANRRNSFYDRKTNKLFNLSNPIRDIEYNDKTDLSGIYHAVASKKPALILYEGKFPKSTVDAWNIRHGKKEVVQSDNKTTATEKKKDAKVEKPAKKEPAKEKKPKEEAEDKKEELVQKKEQPKKEKKAQSPKKEKSTSKKEDKKEEDKEKKK